MCRKLTYLTTLVFALGLTTGVASADLRHHWRLDGDLADIAGSLDLTSVGAGPVFAVGEHGGAVEFDGSGDYLYAELAVFMPSQTTCAWVKTRSSNQSILGWSGGHPTDGLHDRELYVNADGTVTVRVWTGAATTVTSQTPVDDEAWHHLATGYTEGGETWLYVDGVSQGSTPSSGIYNDYPTSYLTIGIESNVNTYLTGAVDDIRVYDEALTQGQVLGAMVGGVFPFAFGPTPQDGAMLTDTWVSLSWSPGDLAVSHDVYLGDDFDDVNDGTTDSPVFHGNQDRDTTTFIAGFFGFPYPDGLVPGTTYYWRIDEVNDAEPNSPWKGDVWSFWIPPRKAYEPDPSDGAEFVDPNLTLSWTAGFGAKLHYVYFGDNFDDVNSATGGQFVPNATYTPGALELERTYYWRVDESDGLTTYKGNVWSFKTRPDIPITDPNLMGWWTLDEGSGTVALDWSGHGNHGTVMGDPQWSAGYDGGALKFGGAGDYVTIPYASHPVIYTITAWVKPTQTSSVGIVVRTSSSGPTVHWSHQLRISSSGVFEHYTYDGTQRSVMGTTAVKANTWYFVVAFATNDGPMRLCVNGQEEGISTSIDTLWAEGDRFLVGSNSGQGMGWFEGLTDDVRIYDYALTLDEIRQVMRIDPLLAWNPTPANGSTPDIENATPLGWSPGDSAAQHAVYFGTDRDAVDNADASDATGVYRGQQVGTSYNPPEGVEFGGGPYYWRIDEHNTDATVSKGSIWSFTVADFIVVDDFESYDDVGNLVYLTWLDGFDNPATNGSTIGYTTGVSMETGNVHGGLQSVPYAYDNNFKSSQATRTFTSLRDWTREGVTKLSLWFYGDPANAPERMNVALNGAAPVYHDDPSAATIGAWTQWTIDLSAFGVPLTNVTSVAIGFGVPGSTAAGGTGNMLFDDVLLIR
jgi:hypothetical protein